MSKHAEQVRDVRSVVKDVVNTVVRQSRVDATALKRLHGGR